MPCNLVNFIFGEPGIGGLAGTAAGGRGEDETEKTRSKVGKTPAGKEKKCGGMRSVTTTTDSTMSSDVRSAQPLCRRGGPGEGGAQQRGGEEQSKKRPARSMCCPHMCSSCHACCLLRQVRSCPSTHYSVCKRFPAGRCGGFFPEASKR